METLADWLAQTALSRLIIGPLWMVPAVQTVHILALAIALTAALMMECQLLKAARGTVVPVNPSRRFLPWIVSALVVLAVSGSILIASEPHGTLLNRSFQTKMVLLALVIALLFARRKVIAGDTSQLKRGSALVGGIASIALWTGIVIAGRWIAYVS